MVIIVGVEPSTQTPYTTPLLETFQMAMQAGLYVLLMTIQGFTKGLLLNPFLKVWTAGGINSGYLAQMLLKLVSVFCILT